MCGAIVSVLHSVKQDERYIAIEHMDKVRPRSGREGALGYVRRDCVSLAQRTRTNGYVQDKVRPGSGREGALGYERYTAGAGAARVNFARLVVVRCVTRNAPSFSTASDSGAPVNPCRWQ